MSDRLRARLPAFALAIVAALLGCGRTVGANEVCQGVPTELDEQAARDAFDAADVAAFVDARAPLEAALDDVCKGNRDSARLFKKEAKRVVFQIAAGAMEPTPYLEEGALVVEFYGGPFDAARFRHDVDAALRGEEPQFND
jgi:hypothetical protein